jgi:hypothetical protein
MSITWERLWDIAQCKTVNANICKTWHLLWFQWVQGQVPDSLEDLGVCYAGKIYVGKRPRNVTLQFRYQVVSSGKRKSLSNLSLHMCCVNCPLHILASPCGGYESPGLAFLPTLPRPAPPCQPHPAPPPQHSCTSEICFLGHLLLKPPNALDLGFATSSEATNLLKVLRGGLSWQCPPIHLSPQLAAWGLWTFPEENLT